MRNMVSERIVLELEAGLDWAAKRQQAIANNIANVDTPGYKRQDVTFPETLAQVQNTKLKLRRTNAGHMSPLATEAFFTIKHQGTSLRNDSNNVDMEAETAELAKNTLYYDALIDRVGGYFRNLRLVISEGRR